jgi:hypothetical protein
VPGAGNPQSFNRYSYVLNNPLKYIDPSGHAECVSTDCNLIIHPTSGNVIVREATSALYALIARIARGRTSAANRLDQILAETSTRIPHVQFGGLGGIPGDYGFQEEFRDDHLYEELWGIERPASQQVGHFLTAVSMGYDQNKYRRLLWLDFIVGHELFSDGHNLVGRAIFTPLQILSPSDTDVFRFRVAVNADADGKYETRDINLQLVLNLSQYGALEDRVGNSMEDLRLSVRGWRLGTMVGTGEMATNKDLANWIALNVAGD